MARSKTSVSAIEIAQRREKVLELRLAGASVRRIAERLNISKSTAHNDLRAAIDAITEEPARAVVSMELQRLDVMLLGLWKGASTGDDKAVNNALRIMDRRAKYLGLDHVAVADTSDEARQALAELMGAIRASVTDEAQ